MGISTDGLICYGILIGEDVPNEVIERCMEFDQHPFVEWVNSCSLDYPVWIAAVPGTHMWVARGYPEMVDHNDINGEIDATSLVEWLSKHELLPEDWESNLGWWLGSCMG